MKSHSKNAITVLEKRYLQKNAEGNFLETPDQLFKRVAKAIAQAEILLDNASQLMQYEEEFYRVLSSLDFLPNSPCLMNAGTKLGQLCACFVLPVEDSMESIFETLKNAALIQQSGGGTGFNFSRLRPEGDFVNKTGGEASGPVSFMKIYDAATQYVKQGGKRRGANMGILNADHPDILKFIRAKREAAALANFNLSVGITDDFMEAVEHKANWKLKHPTSRKTSSVVKAAKLWDEIIRSAWQTGDPGLIFLDEINRHNPTPALGTIKATNPCGEVPLLPYEACNLGSVNLLHMLGKKRGQCVIDWKKLAVTVSTAIRFLDNTIEVNNYLIPQIRNIALGNRKIGLGVMGWAEMLIKLGLPYESEESVMLGKQIMQFISLKSLEASAKLAEKRGVFPNWEKSIYYPKTPLRNATRTSIAPTGTISILANTSPSIEPLFALAYERRNVLDGANLFEVNPLFLDYLKQKKLATRDQLKRLTSKGEGELLAKLPQKVRKLFSSALHISYEYHIKHQLAFQQYTDNAVSKTINLPESATPKDVENAYKMAWKLKTKGITIYRYGSKNNQVLHLKEDATAIQKEACKVCEV